MQDHASLAVKCCRADSLDYMRRAGQGARGHQLADLGAELRLCHEDFGTFQSKTWPHSWHLTPTCSSALSTRSMDIRMALCEPAGHSTLPIPSALSLRLCSSLSIVSSSAETSLNVISISFPFGGVIAGISGVFSALARRRGNAREPEDTLDLSRWWPQRDSNTCFQSAIRHVQSSSFGRLLDAGRVEIRLFHALALMLAC